MIYIGDSGVFAYDLVRDLVTALLLEPLGTDGPIFRVDLTSILK